LRRLSAITLLIRPGRAHEGVFRRAAGALDPADSAVPLSHWLNSTRLVGWLTVGYAAAYVVLAFRSAYGQSFLQAIVKMTVVVMIYGLVFSAVFLGIAIATGGTH
jgi:hypothetical protein